jgi:S1 RNA binding domain protein
VYVRDVKDFLKERDKVKVKVLSVDERGKIGLSIKQLQEPSTRKPLPARAGVRDASMTPASFEDKLISSSKIATSASPT